jgi:hypothetical protein
VIDRRKAARIARSATRRPLADVPVEGPRTWLFRFTDAGLGLGVLVDKRDGRTREPLHAWEVDAYDAGFTEPRYHLHVRAVHDLVAAVEALLPLHLAHVPPPAPGEPAGVQIFDLTWLEAHLGHAPCGFFAQDLRPWLRALDRARDSKSLVYQLEPATHPRAQAVCSDCAKLGRDPHDTAAGFDCPRCGYPSLPFGLDEPNTEAYAKACPICDGPRRPPHPAEIAWRDRRRARR